MTAQRLACRITRRELLGSGVDDQFLDQIERAIFQFFWEQASPTTGQVKDRALAAGNDSRTVSSIASTGFGLTTLCKTSAATLSGIPS